MRILLIEDDPKIASFILKGHRAAGYAVDHAPEGETVLHLSLTEPYDAAVVDVMLPLLDGLSLIGRLQAAAKKPRLRSDVTQIYFGNLCLWLFIACMPLQMLMRDRAPSNFIERLYAVLMEKWILYPGYDLRDET